jgi:hypothetical protein
MLDRPGDDGGEGPAARLAQQRFVGAHIGFSRPIPCSARNANKGSNGRPSTVK